MPSMLPRRRPRPALLALASALSLLGGAAARAQTSNSPSSPVASPPPPQAVVVTGNPLRSSDPAAPSAVLGGDTLMRRVDVSLGATLDGQPGVAATGFTPFASRPVIRGQDGDRVRVLANGGASFDLSALSFDHAVAIDPLAVERVEVLRGPAALLFGGSAIGGVVNLIDHRIPGEPADGLHARSELRLGGAARERSGAVVLDGGQRSLAWHVDAFTRRAADLRVPRHVGPDGSTVDRVINSAGEASGGAVGLSWVDADGHVGASVDGLNSRYGAVAEPDIGIRMRRTRVAVEGERRWREGFWRRLEVKASATDYRHREVDGQGVVGTVFSNRGQELRVEGVHRPLALGTTGELEGHVGVGVERVRSEALGEEAFLPPGRRRGTALSLLERWRFDRAQPDAHLSVGLRTEQVEQTSEGDADGSTARFGPPQQRRFRPLSAAATLALPLGFLDGAGGHRAGQGWSLSLALAHSERAPGAAELYADGPHVATAAWERGDPALGLERGRQLDLGLAWRDAASEFKLNLFHARFDRYLLLARDAGGALATMDDGSQLPIYTFRGVPARLSGFEVQGRRGWRGATGVEWALEARLDAVRGDDLAAGEPLPRLAPLRGTLALQAARGPWLARVELRHAARASRVPQDDTPTPGFTMLNAEAQWVQPISNGELTWFARAQNLGDTLAWQAGSIATVRPLAPLGGRAVTLGVRWTL